MRGYTKGDLIQYYASVVPVLLPHLEGRPISMSRYPEGIKGPSFYEKRAPGHQPDWMRTTPVVSDSQGGVIDFLVADTVEALMWFANMGCIETHPFHSREGRLEHPDYAIFDFDPADGPHGTRWWRAVASCRWLCASSGSSATRSCPDRGGSMSTSRWNRSTGSRGCGVSSVRWATTWRRPIRAPSPWSGTSQRKGKVFIDHNRNASGQTVASVYSVRPRPSAPVSAPLTWDELGEVANGDVTIVDLWDRLQRYGDPRPGGCRWSDPRRRGGGIGDTRGSLSPFRPLRMAPT